jgi:hypothetical protein
MLGSDLSSAGTDHARWFLPRLRRMPTMNFRRISKAVAAALLAVGLITAGVAPATAATTRHAPSSQTDTGWGFK